MSESLFHRLKERVTVLRMNFSMGVCPRKRERVRSDKAGVCIHADDVMQVRERICVPEIGWYRG